MGKGICIVVGLFLTIFMVPASAMKWDIQCSNCIVLDCDMDKEEMCPVLKDIIQMLTGDYLNYNGLVKMCTSEKTLDTTTRCLVPFGHEHPKCGEITGKIFYILPKDFPIEVNFISHGCPAKKLLEVNTSQGLAQEEKFEESGIKYVVEFQVSNANVCSEDMCFGIKNITYVGKDNPVAWALTVSKCLYFGHIHCKRVDGIDVFLLIVGIIILFAMAAMAIYAICTCCRFY